MTIKHQPISATPQSPFGRHAFGQAAEEYCTGRSNELYQQDSGYVELQGYSEGIGGRTPRAMVRTDWIPSLKTR